MALEPAIGVIEGRCQRSRATGWLACAVAVSSAACGRYWVCDEVDEDRTARAARRLSETGLFADTARESLAPGVVAYAPRFELWSDGAEKRRWWWLPPGTRIDTSNMDAWVFPEGTKFWKEFTRDGVRVETRLLEKLGPDEGWVALAYLWRSDHSRGTARAVNPLKRGFRPEPSSLKPTHAESQGKSARDDPRPSIQRSRPARRRARRRCDARVDVAGGRTRLDPGGRRHRLHDEPRADRGPDGRCGGAERRGHRRPGSGPLRSGHR